MCPQGCPRLVKVCKPCWEAGRHFRGHSHSGQCDLAIALDTRILQRLMAEPVLRRIDELSCNVAGMGLMVSRFTHTTGG